MSKNNWVRKPSSSRSATGKINALPTCASVRQSLSPNLAKSCSRSTHSKRGWSCRDREHSSAVTRIRTWVVSATTRSTNHYTIMANAPACTLSLQCCDPDSNPAGSNHLGSHARDPEFVYRPSCSSPAPKNHAFLRVCLCRVCLCRPQVRSTRSPEGEKKTNHTNFRVQYLVEYPFSGGGVAAQFLPSLAVYGSLSKHGWSCRDREHSSAVTRIRTWVVSATTRSTNHYTITANAPTYHCTDITQRSWVRIPGDENVHVICPLLLIKLIKP